MNTDTETRLEQLEIGLAHASQTIEELNTVVITQGKQIDRMSRLLSSMSEQVEDLVDNVFPGHPVEKPPHY